jgi:hypothetical protein
LGARSFVRWRACFYIWSKLFLVGSLDAFDLTAVAIGLLALVLTWSYAKKLFAKPASRG